jgi:hypothetical protein
VIVDFVRVHAGHREPGGLRWGVEPICRVLTEHGLPIAPSTYYELVNKAATARDQRDALLINEIRRVHRENYCVYGAQSSRPRRRGQDNRNRSTADAALFIFERPPPAISHANPARITTSPTG